MLAVAVEHEDAHLRRRRPASIGCAAIVMSAPRSRCARRRARGSPSGRCDRRPESGSSRPRAARSAARPGARRRPCPGTSAGCRASARPRGSRRSRPRTRSRRYVSEMWRLSDAELNCVSTKMRRMSACRQPLTGRSMRRYLPPIGTAGFERVAVSGKRREPWPPPSTMASVSLIITHSNTAMLRLAGQVGQVGQVGRVWTCSGWRASPRSALVARAGARGSVGGAVAAASCAALTKAVAAAGDHHVRDGRGRRTRCRLRRRAAAGPARRRGQSVRRSAGGVPRRGDAAAERRLRHQDGAVAARRRGTASSAAPATAGWAAAPASTPTRWPAASGAATRRPAHNTGHEGDSSYALEHPEQIKDFGYRATHEMTVASKALIRAFYGKRADARRTWPKAAAARSRRSARRSAIPTTTTRSPSPACRRISRATRSRRCGSGRPRTRTPPASSRRTSIRCCTTRCSPPATRGDGLKDGVVGDPIGVPLRSRRSVQCKEGATAGRA